MTVFRALSARERIEPTLAARIEQLAHPGNSITAHAKAKQLLDQVEAEARQPVEAERDRLLGFIERGQTEHIRFGVIKADGTAELGECADWCYARKLEKAEAQVARIRAFLADLAGWCSPHGVAADYARRGLDALDGVDPLGRPHG